MSGGHDIGVPLISVNDIELFYESRGDGAPVVLLGGLGSDVSEMGGLIGPLAGTFRVIAVDNRGAGRSAKPPGPYTIEQMADDAEGLMDRLSLARADVFGISMGGRIAMAMALAHPDRVNRLVLVATGPRAGGSRWLVRAGMWVAGLPLLRGSHRQPRQAMRAQYDATTRFDCTSRLGEISAPVLIVHGRSDRVAPPAFARQMHALIPGSRLVWVDGGHWAPMFTQHERVAAETRAFLAG